MGSEKTERPAPSGVPEFFVLDNCMYHVSQIVFLRLDGGSDGFGCWGQIELRGEPRCTIGDGSYAQDQEPFGRHVRHRVAGEYGFQRLREIMRAYGLANKEKL